MLAWQASTKSRLEFSRVDAALRLAIIGVRQRGGIAITLSPTTRARLLRSIAFSSGAGRIQGFGPRDTILAQV